MERRLLRIIVNPAMMAVWVLGLTIAFTPASGGPRRVADGQIRVGASLSQFTGFFPLAERFRRSTAIATASDFMRRGTKFRRF
jgi:uncharacterized membrane protein